MEKDINMETPLMTCMF